MFVSVHATRSTFMDVDGINPNPNTASYYHIVVDCIAQFDVYLISGVASLDSIFSSYLRRINLPVNPSAHSPGLILLHSCAYVYVIHISTTFKIIPQSSAALGFGNNSNTSLLFFFFRLRLTRQ